MKISVLAITIISLGSFNSIAQSTGVWSGNGHYYEVVSTPQNISWTEAQNTAQQRGGYLATITSVAENTFISGLGATGSRWIGGFQPAGSSEPTGGWKWVTGESFSYTNWYPGEPNNYGADGPEDFLHLVAGASTWNDFSNFGSGQPVQRYVVEYDSHPQPKIFGLAIGVNDGQGVRGDKDSTNVFNALQTKNSWAPASLGNPQAPLKYDYSGNPNLFEIGTEIKNSLDSMKVKSGDTVVFYYSGHGSSTVLDGDETPVTIKGVQDTGDEMLNIGGFDLTDDTLAEWFSEPKWTGVTKVFMLDTCFSGGFMGDNLTSDTGDLETLSDWVLFAAASESSTAHSMLTGDGIYTTFGLLPLLNNDWVNLSEMDGYIQGLPSTLLAQFGGQSLFVRGGYGPGDMETFGFTPQFSVSTNIDLSSNPLAIPEPSISTLIGLAAGCWFICKRRKI